MSQFRKSVLLGVTTILLMGGLGAGISNAGPGADTANSKVKKFVPGKFRGTWSGSWNNLTFDTTGKASIRLKVKGNRRKPVMFGVFRLGGEAFGCESAPPRPVRMEKGQGWNRWNNRGFKAAWRNGKGPIRITYNHHRGRISGTGFSPCSERITYSFGGKMNARVARAKTRIFFDGEPFATSRLNMRRK